MQIQIAVFNYKYLKKFEKIFKLIESNDSIDWLDII